MVRDTWSPDIFPDSVVCGPRGVSALCAGGACRGDCGAWFAARTSQTMDRLEPAWADFLGHVYRLVIRPPLCGDPRISTAPPPRYQGYLPRLCAANRPAGRSGGHALFSPVVLGPGATLCLSVDGEIPSPLHGYSRSL